MKQHMNSNQILVFFSFLLGALFDCGCCTDCYDAYSCAFTTLRSQSQAVNCFGHKSCFESPEIHSIDWFVFCYGSYSCSQTELMIINGSRLECNGFKSCARINELQIIEYNENSNDEHYCYGDQSCINSRISIGGISTSSSLLCDGMLSCANTIVNISHSNAAISIRGGLSGYNATFISDKGSQFYFAGHNSGFLAKIICGLNATCNIACYSNGCNGLTLLCDSNDNNGDDNDEDSCAFDVICLTAAKSDSCPNVYEGMYTLDEYLTLDEYVIEDVNLVENISSILLQSDFEYDGDDDINIISNVSHGDGLDCNDYQACIEYTFDWMYNDSYIEYGSYIESMHNINDTNDGYAVTSNPVYCGGSDSCFFTNINIVLNSKSNNNNSYSNGNDDQSLTGFSCDGYQACITIPSFVSINSSFNNQDQVLNAKFRGSDSGKELTIMTMNNNNNNNNNSSQVNVNIICTAYQSCCNQTMESTENVYCHGFESCVESRIINVEDSIWVYGEKGAQESQIYNVLNNLYLAGFHACVACNVSNINGNIYAIGGSALRSAKIRNVSGNLFGISSAALYEADIQNVTSVYCVSENTCDFVTIRSVKLIVQTYPTGISYATIFSDMANYGAITTNNDDDDEDNSTLDNTMTVKLYHFNFDFSIYCSKNDICRIGCFGKEACINLDLYCNGTCLVDCDDGSDYHCPTIKFGTYSVWYSNSSGSSGNSTDDSETTGSDSDNDDDDSVSQRLYQAIVTGFSVTALSIAICIVLGVCGYEFVQSLSASRINKMRKNKCDFGIIKDNLCNSDIVIFFIVFCICIFLGFICILYGFGQITQLILSNYWCDKKSLNEIYQHSEEYNLNEGTNDGCWKSKQFTVDTNALFQSSSVYSTSSDFSVSNTIRCIVWLFSGVSFIWMAVMFVSLQLSNIICGKICFSSLTINDTNNNNRSRNSNNNTENDETIEIAMATMMSNEEKQTSVNATPAGQTKSQATRSGRRQSHPSSFHRCCPCCCCLPRNNKFLEFLGDMFFKWKNWYQFYFGEDTRNWFILLSIREIIEITLQVFAAYNYNGLNILSPNEVVLSFEANSIKLFCILLSLNCVFTGMLWLFYVFVHKLCHGQFFKQTVFFIDTIFDTFYALFPIIVIGQQTEFNLRLAVSVLQATNMYVSFFEN